MSRMTNISLVALVISCIAFAGTAYLNSQHKARLLEEREREEHLNRPVAVDVVPKFIPAGPVTALHMKWRNQRECKFRELVAMQGSTRFPDQVRSPIKLNFGKPVGSRGAGGQATGPEGWSLERPAILTGPEIILTAWHRCGDRDIPSTMFVVPIDKVFPK